MRIADKMNYDQVKSNLAKNRSEMAELQNQAATQKRVNKPSDDPLAATRVLAARTEIGGSAQFMKNVNNAKAFLEYSDQSLSELSEALVRAKELAISQSNDASANERSREVTASEIEQIHSQAIQIGNRKLGDRFLFGGFRTTRPPFDPNGEYHGDNGEIFVTINKEASVAMNVPGSQVFLGRDLKNGASSRDEKAFVAPKPVEPAAQEPMDGAAAEIRGPAGAGPSAAEAGDADGADGAEPSNLSATWKSSGRNVFKVLKDLEIALRTNDKAAIQESMDAIDETVAQVILARSQVGSRAMTLNSGMESLQKAQVDSKTLASSLEDADTFELVSELNKSESTLKASLATSSKLIQPSLLDFLR